VHDLCLWRHWIRQDPHDDGTSLLPPTRPDIANSDLLVQVEDIRASNDVVPADLQRAS